MCVCVSASPYSIIQNSKSRKMKLSRYRAFFERGRHEKSKKIKSNLYVALCTYPYIKAYTKLLKKDYLPFEKCSNGLLNVELLLCLWIVVMFELNFRFLFFYCCCVVYTASTLNACVFPFCCCCFYLFISRSFWFWFFIFYLHLLHFIEQMLYENMRAICCER